MVKIGSSDVFRIKHWDCQSRLLLIIANWLMRRGGGGRRDEIVELVETYAENFFEKNDKRKIFKKKTKMNWFVNRFF